MEKKQVKVPIRLIFREAYALLVKNWRLLVKLFLAQAALSILFQIFGSGSSAPLVKFQIMILSLLATYALQVYTTVRMLALIRGAKVTVDYRSLFIRALKVYGATILVGLLSLVGFLLFIFPGIYLSLKYCFTVFILADKQIGFRQAFALSAQMTKGIKLALFVFGLAQAGLILLGLLALGIGLLVTIPLCFIADFVLYERLLEQQKSI